MRKILLVMLVGFFGGICLFADDVLEPSWRGEERSARAEWNSWDSILTNPFYVEPDIWDYWGGSVYMPYFFWDWNQNYTFFPQKFGRLNVVRSYESNPGYLYLPNYPDGDLKKVRLQVTYYNVEGYCGLLGYLGMKVSDTSPFWDISRPPIYTEDHGDGWYTDVFDFEIVPNPQEEWVTFGFDPGLVYPGGTPSYISQVVVDTICIPEPASLALVAMGALVLKRRK